MAVDEEHARSPSPVYFNPKRDLAAKNPGRKQKESGDDRKTSATTTPKFFTAGEPPEFLLRGVFQVSFFFSGEPAVRNLCVYLEDHPI